MQKLYEILKNKSYLIDEKLRDIGTNGTTIVYYEYDTIPYIFGYSLRKLNFSVMTKSGKVEYCCPSHRGGGENFKT